MDEVKPPRGSRRGAETEVSVPVQHDGGVYEESWHHLRLHEKAVPGPHRHRMPGHGAQQEVGTSE